MTAPSTPAGTAETDPHRNLRFRASGCDTSVVSSEQLRALLRAHDALAAENERLTADLDFLYALDTVLGSASEAERQAAPSIVRDCRLAREQAEAALAEVRDESWRTGPVPHGTQYIIVRETRSYRWLPYKGKSEQFRKGIKGRWQRATEYGWENAPIPDGADWRTMEQSPAAAASPHPTAESDE